MIWRRSILRLSDSSEGGVGELCPLEPEASPLEMRSAARQGFRHAKILVWRHWLRSGRWELNTSPGPGVGLGRPEGEKASEVVLGLALPETHVKRDGKSDDQPRTGRAP
jgi:hypothetical protein